MLLLIISLAAKPTLESLLKQSFALFPTFESTFQIIEISKFTSTSHPSCQCTWTKYIAKGEGGV